MLIKNKFQILKTTPCNYNLICNNHKTKLIKILYRIQVISFLKMKKLQFKIKFYLVPINQKTKICNKITLNKISLRKRTLKWKLSLLVQIVALIRLFCNKKIMFYRRMGKPFLDYKKKLRLYKKTQRIQAKKYKKKKKLQIHMKLFK